MTRAALQQLTTAAVEALVQKGAFPDALRQVPVQIEVPADSSHGDFSTNFALVSAKAAGKPPRAIAETLAAELADHDALEKVEVAGPGFLNLTLKPAAVAEGLAGVLAKGDEFGRLESHDPQRINVEFVSVNPNGPITIGSGRGAAYGSALCNVLEAAGHIVHREYYINDGTSSEQMRLFAESVKAIMEGREVPENGYKGDYVYEVAELLGRPGELDLLLSHVSASKVNNMLELGQNWQADQSVRSKTKLETAVFAALPDYFRLDRHRAEQTLDIEGSLTAENKSIEEIKKTSELAMILLQYQALESFGTTFDTWYSEQSLHDTGAVQQKLEELTASHAADEEPTRRKITFAKGGAIKEVEQEAQPTDEDDAEGAGKTLWLRSTKFGDDQDRVLRRKDGRPTYIASDVAYHEYKFNRPVNADKLITILGPDHHGYIGRLTAVVAAMKMDQVEPLDDASPLTEHEALIYHSVEERNRCRAALEWAKQHLEVRIFQIVRFLKDGKPAPMRKRDGNIYALIDLVNEIGQQVRPNATTEEQQQAGSDVARFFYLMRHHDTAMDFDLELATRQSDENPVFYVQYAHARICSVLSKAAEAGITAEGADVSRLVHPREKTLALKIFELEHIVSEAANDHGVNRLANYATELARTYHHFYDVCRVVDLEDVETSRARVLLCEAARTALKNVLTLLGISAPERMERDAQSA